MYIINIYILLSLFYNNCYKCSNFLSSWHNTFFYGVNEYISVCVCVCVCVYVCVRTYVLLQIPIYTD